jgi:ribonuclease P protein component
MRFRSEQHLRRQTDIRAVREQGRRVDCRAFTIWWKPREKPADSSRADLSATALATGKSPPKQEASGARVCVIASTAAVGAATHRNRAKRRLRELFRQQQGQVPADCDLLLIARSAAIEWPMPDLERKFVEACRQISSPAKSTKE